MCVCRGGGVFKCMLVSPQLHKPNGGGGGEGEE